MSGPLLRFDVTTGDWVAFSAARALRPHELTPQSQRPTADYDPACPFCPGAALHTVLLDEEPQRGSASAHDAPWQVRALANRYPALMTEEPLARRSYGPLFREMSGHGAHEVIVISPHHSRPLALSPLDEIALALNVMRRRCAALGAQSNFEVVQLFQNHGTRAGASMQHPHFQILAAPVVPRQMRIKYEVAAEYYHANGSSVYSDLCRDELASGERLVFANAEFVAFAPFASRVAFETWIIPRAGGTTFADLAPDKLPLLAEAIQAVLGRLYFALSDPAYNLIVNSAPRRHTDEPDFVWHIEILPRLSIEAGFELATGMAINTVLPETAAATLRAAEAQAKPR